MQGLEASEIHVTRHKHQLDHTHTHEQHKGCHAAVLARNEATHPHVG